MRRINLEPVIQSEVSQKEKNKYHILMHIYGIYKNGTDEPISQTGASLVAQRLKRLPAMQEISVRSLGGEDPLEKEMTTHSSILAWRIPWTEEPGRLQSMGSQRVGHD